MTHDSTLNTLNLNMLPFNEQTCAYHNELFLADNFDEPHGNIHLSNKSRIA